MTENPCYELGQGEYGPKLILRSRWTTHYEKTMLEYGIQELRLNHGSGWDGEDLHFLRQFPHLKALAVTHYGLEDIGAIQCLRELRTLELFTYSKTVIDFRHFPKLEECSLEWTKGVSSALFMRQLSKLFINRIPKASVSTIGEMIGLRELGLLSCGVESLECISALTKLESLRLARFSKLTSNTFLSHLTELRDLWIQNCSGFYSFEPLRKHLLLETIGMHNCGPFESLEPLRNLKRLRSFVLSGPRNEVLDGGYGPVEDLPNLDNYFR